MPVHPRFREHADNLCASMQEGSLVIQSHRILSLEDDGDPEGGVLVKACFNLGGDFTDWASAPNLVEWASRAIKSKLGVQAGALHG